MEEINRKILVGERALFQKEDLLINECIFEDGESPLKESKNIILNNTSFKWKYPLWYSKNIVLNNCVLFEMARSGIWYTDNITFNDCLIEAPKSFRRSNNIVLNNVSMPNASETFWNSNNITLNNVVAKGDYFGFNSKNVKINNFTLYGNYCFDGGSDIEIHNAKLLSKDSFWNCNNVVVYDSYICGEYLGWNSKNIKFVNCTIESLQGFCYMDNVILENCKLINTTRSFEYSSVKANIIGKIDSVVNPKSGYIKANNIDKIVLDDPKINKNEIKIEVDR